MSKFVQELPENNIVASAAVILVILGVLHDEGILANISDYSQEVLAQTYSYPRIVVGFIGLLLILLIWNLFRVYLNKSKSFS